MKKLTLEHLAGYLPYKLQCITDKASYSNPIKGELTMIETDSEEQNICIVPEHGGYALCEINRTLKPILRPLSDLTKEIEVGGEKFVAIDRINSLFPEYPLIKDSVCGINVFFISDSCELNMLSISEVYKIYQKLYSWHFDIHNLISEGLAIDINTLNN